MTDKLIINRHGGAIVLISDTGGILTELATFDSTGLTVQGNLDVQGTTTTIDTELQLTDQLFITNAGTGPALQVNQTGAQPVARFQDDGTTVFNIADGGIITLGSSGSLVTHVVNAQTLQGAAASGGFTLQGRSAGSVGDAFCLVLAGFGTTGNATLGSIVIRRDTADTNGLLVFNTALSGTNRQVGQVDSSGAWILGLSAGTQTHSINGILQINSNTSGANQLNLKGFTSGILSIKTPDTVSAHTLILPSSQGGSNTYLRNDGSGNLSWASASAPTLQAVYDAGHTVTLAAGTSYFDLTAPSSATGEVIRAVNNGTASSANAIRATATNGVAIRASSSGSYGMLLDNGGSVATLSLTNSNNGTWLALTDTSGNQSILIKAPASQTGHTLTLPNAQGGANTYLKNDGSGNLSWASVAGGGQTVYKAIVDAAGGGNYTSISTACSTEPAGATIYVRNGTYTETSAIQLKSGQSIIGESKEGVIVRRSTNSLIMFATDQSIQNSTSISTSTGLPDSASGGGTLTLTNASTTVTFSQAVLAGNSSDIGKAIITATHRFIITAGISTTTATIAAAWGGATTSGITYQLYAGATVTDIQVRNITLDTTNLTSANACTFNGSIGTKMKDIIIKLSTASYSGFALQVSGAQMELSNITCTDNGNGNMNIANCLGASIENISLRRIGFSLSGTIAHSSIQFNEIMYAPGSGSLQAGLDLTSASCYASNIRVDRIMFGAGNGVMMGSTPVAFCKLEFGEILNNAQYGIKVNINGGSINHKSSIVVGSCRNNTVGDVEGGSKSSVALAPAFTGGDFGIMTNMGNYIITGGMYDSITGAPAQNNAYLY